MKQYRIDITTKSYIKVNVSDNIELREKDIQAIVENWSNEGVVGPNFDSQRAVVKEVISVDNVVSYDLDTYIRVRKRKRKLKRIIDE